MTSQRLVAQAFRWIETDLKQKERPSVPMDAGSMRQFQYLARAFHRISEVPGDIVECGVGKGRTFLMFAYLISQERARRNRTLWGFDSFRGFPEPSAQDASPRNSREGEGADTSVKRIRNLLKECGIDPGFLLSRVRLIPGFFQRSLHKFPDRPIALLHIDADLYQSYRDALSILFPKVAQGGWVLFDEYRRPDWPGATKAIEEWIASTAYKIRYDDLANRYFVIKRRSR